MKTSLSFTNDRNHFYDYEAKNAIHTLAYYCLEHNQCEGCIFKPKNYKPVENECLLEHKPPIGVEMKLLESEENE